MIPNESSSGVGSTLGSAIKNTVSVGTNIIGNKINKVVNNAIQQKVSELPDSGKYTNIYMTVPDLTGGRYSELRFNAASDTPIEGEYISNVWALLGKCGIDIELSNVYDENMEAGVKQFQAKVNMSQTGILNNETLSAMIYYAYRMSDSIEDDGVTDSETDTQESKSPHYNSYFDDDKFKIHRLNHKDIKIVLGNHSVIKTLKDVFMRSVSVEVDTSGNPISEVYEFIARDVKESDELSDVTKYNGEEVTASSDIKYIFNFK